MAVKYHNPDTCNKCGERANEYRGSFLYNDEFDTTCRACGHKDHWGYGFFDSAQDGLNACAKYTTTGTW